MRRFLRFTFFLSLVVYGLPATAQPDWDFAFPEGSDQTNISSEEGTKVVADDGGFFYVTGSFGGTAFGGSVTSNGNLDIFVAKYDGDGNVIWVTTIGTGNLETAGDIAYDESSNRVYVIGTVRGDLSGNVNVKTGWIPGPESTTTTAVVDNTGNDIYVGVFNAGTGSVIFSTTYGGSNNDVGYGISVDAVTDDIYICGDFQGTANFGVGFDLVNTAAFETDAFLVKIGAGLTTQWAYSIGSLGSVSARGLDVWDGNGLVAITGSFEQGITYNGLGGPVLEFVATGSKDIFVALYGSDGSISANDHFEAGGAGNDAGAAVLYQQFGDVHVAGYVGGDATFGGLGSITGLGNDDIFVGKIVGGDWAWVDVAGSSAQDRATDIAHIQNDEILVTGYLGGDATFGSATVPIAVNGITSKDVFVAKYQRFGGAPFFVLTGGGSSGDQANGIGASGNRAFVTGEFNSTDASFGGLGLAAASGTTADDIFVLGLTGVGQFYEDGISLFDETYFNTRAAWGDIDADGDLDLVYTGYDGLVYETKMYTYNPGAGDFTLFTTKVGRSAGNIQFIDIDNDGAMDMHPFGFGGLESDIYLNNSGVFAANDFNVLSLGAGSMDWADYDLDGDLDLLVNGEFSNVKGASIYRNDDGVLTDIGAALPATAFGGVKWADLDGTGQLELMIFGEDDLLTPIFQVAYADGNGEYFNGGTVVNYTAHTDGDIAVSDYDNDGDYDFAIIGNNSSDIPTTFIYENVDGVSFNPVSFSFTGFNQGGIDWGDYDNDGDADLLITGEDDAFEAVAIILQNDGGNVFTEVDFEFTGLTGGDAQFGDYDNDGDLDIVLTGEDDLSNSVVDVWKNETTATNGPPGQVVVASTSVNMFDATLTWNTGADDITPTNGLTYNLAVYRTSGGTDYVVSPNAKVDGTYLVARDGNMGKRTSITLRGLDPGDYYWKVQAVDGAYKAGQFSTEQMFTVVDPNFEVAFFDFTGGSTTDVLGNGFTGTVVNATQTDDRFNDPNNAYNFDPNDGSRDNIIGNASFGLDQTMTIAAWIRPDDLGTGRKTIISERLGTAESWEFAIQDDFLYFSKWSSSLVQSSFPGAPGNLTIGQWQHVAVTYDGSLLRFSINGQQTDQIPMSGDIRADVTPFQIGRRGTDEDYFDGDIDDIHVYNYALSNQEVLDLYNSESGLRHWFLEAGDPNDIVGGLIATLNGVITPTPDRFGNSNAAFFFDGASNYSYGQNTIVGGSNRFSISSWVRPNTSGEFVGTIMSENDVVGQQTFYLDLGANEEAVFVSFPDGNTPETTATPGGEVTGFEWNHVVVTYDNGNVEIYVNNQLAVNGTHSAVFDGNSTLFIGAGSPLDANLDDVRIYNYPLSTNEISQLFFENGWTGVSTIGLIASYPFNGNADDATGNGFDATVNGGASLTTDRFGNANSAYSFDGIDDFVSPAQPLLNNFTDFTVAGWVKPTSTGTRIGFFGQNDLLEFGYVASDTVVAWSDVNGFGPQYIDFSLRGSWRHVAAVGNSTGITLYIDGTQVASASASIVDYGSSTFNFNIGGGGIWDPAGNWFTGSIDDVVVYNTALSQTEIQTLFNVGGWTGPSDLVAYWPVTAADGGNDLSGNSNHLDDEASGVGASGIDRFKSVNETFEFTGTNYAVARNTNHPQGDFSASYSFWEYHSTDHFASLIHIGDRSLGNGGHGAIQLQNGGVLGYNDGQTNVQTAATVQTGRWNHIVYIKKPGEVEIYLNGVAYGPGTLNAGFQNITNTDVFVGSSDQGDEFFLGKTDDIRIYNYAIGESEVLSLFNEGVDLNQQIATIDPPFASDTDEVTITYNAERGNKALMGADRVYIHVGAVTGATTNYSWGLYALDTTWFQNTPDNGVGEMTEVATNRWELTLSPDLRTALKVPTDTIINRLGMIFRSPDASVVGKGTPSEYGDFPGGRVEDGTNWTPGDIYLDLFNPTELEADSLALVALYNSTNGATWTNNTGWLTGALDTWFGVTVDTDLGRVTAVDLDGNNLTGTLPNEIGTLTACQYFSMSTNSVGGSIPSAFGSMTALLEIYLDNNNFTGTIPGEIGDLPNLQTFEAYTNALTGNIPASFANLDVTLLFLDVENNQLSGSIPSFIGNMSALQSLWLSDNDFSGTIPVSLGNLSNLQELYLYGNNLSGDIPSELGSLSNLRILELDNNQLTGSIPGSLTNLSQLSDLDLSNNMLSGSVPQGFSSFTGLVEVALYNNFLNSIPDLSASNGLAFLYIEDNKFSIGDILVNLNVPDSMYSFDPQKLHGNIENRFVTDGEDYTFDLGFDQSVTGSTYTWYLNGSQFGGTTTSPELVFSPITGSESGTWYVEVTNTSLPGFQLTTEDININVTNLCISKPIGDVDFAAETDTRIDQVVFGDLDNTSDLSACATYTNFTQHLATVYPGQVVDIELTLGTCGSELAKAAAIFADWNLDGDFDDTSEELYRMGTFISDSNPVVDVVTIPNDAPVGTTTVLRIVARETQDVNSISGCGTYGWGETEDYAITVVAATRDLVVQIDDIQPTSFFNSATPAIAGQDNIMMSATVTNLGAADVSALTGGLELLVSRTQVLDGSEVSAGSIDLNDLAAGESSSIVDQSLPVPAGLPTGSYYLFLRVDPSDQVAETDEGNNSDVSDQPIFVETGDTAPPSITLTNSATSYTLGTGGITLTADITDDVGVLGAVFAWAKLTEITDDFDSAQYTIIIPENSSGSTFSHRLTDVSFDELGVQYFFAAVDAAGNEAISSPFPRKVFSGFSTDDGSGLALTSTRAVANADSPQETDYRIFSVPVINATVGGILGLSTIDKEKVRVWQYNGGNSELSSASSTLSAGKGYWLIYLSGEVDLGFGGTAVNASFTDPFDLPISSGINLIGNPYNFPISWQAVIDHNVNSGIIGPSDVSGLVFFEGFFADRGINTNLGATEGAFIQSSSPVTLEIPVNAKTSKLASSRRLSRQPLDSDDWVVALDIENEFTRYEVAAFGMHPEASMGQDKFDLLSMPFLFDFLQLNSVNPQTEEQISKDIVESTDGFVWDFEASTSYPESRSVLKWDNSYFGDNDVQLYLYDPANQRIVNMRETSEYHFQLKNKFKLQIVYGNRGFVESQLLPGATTLGTAYPNPFTDQTLIPFTLSENHSEYTVNLAVYNSMGQQIKVLLENENMDPGFYNVKWDGRNSGGQELAEGMFIFRLTLRHEKGTEQLSGRLISR